MARERQCEENKDQTWAWLWALPFTTYMTLTNLLMFAVRWASVRWV